MMLNGYSSVSAPLFKDNTVCKVPFADCDVESDCPLSCKSA